MLPTHLKLEIIFLLTVKAAALALLYILFFSPTHDTSLLPVAAHLLGSP